MLEHSLLSAHQGMSQHGMQELACQGTGSAMSLLPLEGCMEEQALLAAPPRRTPCADD